MGEHQFFYHATSFHNYLEIVKTGCIKQNSFFAVKEIAEYYASVIRDEGDTPVLLSFPANLFDNAEMMVDQNGIDEPVTYSAFGLTEEDVHDAWEESDKSVDACIDLIGSFRYREEVMLA